MAAAPSSPETSASSLVANPLGADRIRTTSGRSRRTPRSPRFLPAAPAGSSRPFAPLARRDLRLRPPATLRPVTPCSPRAPRSLRAATAHRPRRTPPPRPRTGLLHPGRPQPLSLCSPLVVPSLTIGVTRPRPSPSAISTAAARFKPSVSSERIRDFEAHCGTRMLGLGAGCFRISSLLRARRGILFVRDASSKLFVGGLSYDTNETVLKDAFDPYGEILEVKVICYQASGKSKGFAFIQFASESAAATALEKMDGQLLDERSIRVHYANNG